MIPRNSTVALSSYPANQFILLNSEFRTDQYVFGFEVFGTQSFTIVSNIITLYNITRICTVQLVTSTNKPSNPTITYQNITTCVNNSVPYNVTQNSYIPSKNNGSINIKVKLNNTILNFVYIFF